MRVFTVEYYERNGLGYVDLKYKGFKVVTMSTEFWQEVKRGDSLFYDKLLRLVRHAMYG